MKMASEDPMMSSEEDEEMSGLDSDEELQEAFAKGKIKPGSTVILDKAGKPVTETDKLLPINNVPLIQLKLEKIKLPSNFGWLERLDLVNDVAPLAPEIALQLEEHKGKRSREIKMINNQRKKKSTAVSQPSLKSVDEDVVHNDFVREMAFYRQAQEAVLKCLPRLRAMNVPTKRPDDYFAEMAKSDTHMQRVAQVLLKKQTASERAEKVRKLREQKKFAKQTQVHVMQERQKAKKEMIESVKKYTKGQKGGSLDCLDDVKAAKGNREKKAPSVRAGGKTPEKRVNRRRLIKNEKYGYGGKKKGAKWNTRESLDNFDDSGKGGRGGGGGRGGRGGGGRGRGGPPGGGFGGSKRPGKQSRQKMKAKGN